MVTQQFDAEAEVAEAEARGVAAEELAALGGVAIGDESGKLTYQVSEADKLAWRPAWRLEIGVDGLEYGKPMKLPRNTDALSIYLKKRRLDGGRMFTLNMPERIMPHGQFQCFANPEACQKRIDTKNKLVQHMEAYHPAESAWLKDDLDLIRASARNENPVRRRMVELIAATPDGGSVPIDEDVREEYDATVPVVPEAADPVVLSVVSNNCQFCPWPEGSVKWANKPPTAQALKLHIGAKHSVAKAEPDDPIAAFAAETE